MWTPRVEFVGWQGEARDVTRFVTSLSWSCSVLAPWETITLGLRCDWVTLQQLIPGQDNGRRGVAGQVLQDPRPGFVVVVRDPLGVALAWGRAARIRTRWSNNPEGASMTDAVEIACESWLSMLARARLVCVSSPEYAVGAALVTVPEWYDLLTQTVLSRGLVSPPGESFDRWWRAAGAAFRVPDQLMGGGQGIYGTQIPLVFDRQSAAAYAPMRLPQTLRVPGTSLQAYGSASVRGSWLGWMQSTFVGDPSLCEMFPSLEYPTERVDASDGPWRDPEDGVEGGIAIPYTDLGARSFAGELTTLAQGLGGAQPVLIYRQRPGLVEPLTTSSALNHARGDAPEVPRAQEVGELEWLPTSYAQEPIGQRPLFGVRWYDLDPQQVLDVDLSWDDSDRINGVNVSLSGAGAVGVGLWGALGQPIVGGRSEVENHGLRLLEVDWPICPPGVNVSELSKDQERLRAQIGDKVTALAEIVWALGAGVDRDFFPARVTVQAAFAPYSRAGHWLRVDAGQGRKLTGYIDRVIHSMRAEDDGKLSARSTFTLSRVALGEGAQAPFPLRFSDVGDFVDVTTG
jgi:hypothetical protein